ncbi:MAG: c-type cytochrome [Chthoniobacteraceae bacterium]
MNLTLAFLAALTTTAFAAVQAPPLPDAPPSAKPGLTLTFTAPDGKTDTRGARLVALFVPGDQSPTPFLSMGAFTAKWEGSIDSPLRAEYAFSAESSGGFRLTINGAPVADGASVRLNKGANPIVAELPRAASGDTFVRLKWSARDFPIEPVPPTVFTHDVNAKELRAGERLREGRLLFAQSRCTACHDGAALLPPKGEGLPELAQDAPVFDQLGAKYREPWLAHWISDPHSIRPHALMPKIFNAKPGEVAQSAADLAAYFATLGVPAAGKPIDESLAPEGGALFANLGCIACHPRPDADGPDERDRVPLSHVKAKWQVPELTAWLKDPAKNYQWNRMPHFRLSDDDAARLTAYLITTANREFPDGPKGDAAKGGALLATSGCLNCHAGLPPTTAPTLDATLAKGWTTGCVAADASARGKAPDFAFTPAQRDALTAFASSGFAALKQDAPAEFAERQIKNLRCTACHSRDAEQSVWSQLEDETAPLQAAAPLEEGEGKPIFTTALPPLTWLGEKLRPEWMASFVAGHGGEKPRPWIVARMPGFTSIAEPLARGIAFQHGYPLAEPALKVDPELAKAGETLLGENGGFNCTTCHGVGAKPGTAVFEAPGINLALTRERLRHDYYLRWVLFPQRIDPETKMSRFADDDGKTPLTDFFDGKASAQFEAIWHYLQSLKK